MDRFTRNYSMVLGVITLIVLGLWLASLDFRAMALNDLLEDDAQLAAYPYRFQVVAVEGDTAVITSPRSPEVPAVHFLAVLHPALAGKNPNDPALVAAEQELAAHQGRARELILAEPDIDTVRWRLDRAWYAERGVVLP